LCLESGKRLEETATGEYVNIMGDFNAQVGTERNGYENIIGKFGEGTSKQEGENLLDMCNRNQWMIGNGMVQEEEKSQNHKVQLGWKIRNNNRLFCYVKKRMDSGNRHKSHTK
jgi:hypothetical protein